MPKIDLRKAVQNVQDYFAEFNDILGNNLDNLLIEETELSGDGKFWLITVGFDREVDPKKEKVYMKNTPIATSLAANLLPQKQILTVERVYKTFKVDSSTGEVVSMKMYKL